MFSCDDLPNFTYLDPWPGVLANPGQATIVGHVYPGGPRLMCKESLPCRLGRHNSVRAEHRHEVFRKRMVLTSTSAHVELSGRCRVEVCCGALTRKLRWIGSVSVDHEDHLW